MPKTNSIKSIRNSVKEVRKRDGTIVPFDLDRIVHAVHKAMIAAGEGSEFEAAVVAHKVTDELIKIAKKYKGFVPNVEGIQDSVEEELIFGEYAKTAKAYIIYREKRSALRAKGVQVPAHVKRVTEESKKYFKGPLGEFVYYRTYAKWIEKEKRRETWIETVDRYMNFMKGKLKRKISEKEYVMIRTGILKHEAMPSMRLLQFAGPAAERTNVCAYNCSYIAPESFQDIAEIMYISMCGTGAGWSVESQNVEKFPQVKLQTGKKFPAYEIPDSKEGWANALAFGMKAWADGSDVEFDYKFIRPAGARLKTMGGKASGPEPLRKLLDFTRLTMLSRQNKRLRTIDVHDIICMIGDCVVSGGVRRSAMISLSDLDDTLVRDSKKGQFYNTHPHRSLANNSAVYVQKPTTEEFLHEWMALVESRSGERGIFNRGSLGKSLPERRIQVLKEYSGYFDAKGENIIGTIGTNPCGEIILQSKQFCNLSEVVARKEDTLTSLLRKIKLATILGTYQASLTHFPYLSVEWKEHCERERLLGVSITGQWDCPVLREHGVFEKLRNEAIRINKIYAKKFGINPATCITCVKPSGTLSQMVDCASGMHPRHAPYYIRRVRISATDALFKMLRDQGVPYHPEVGQIKDSATTYVIDFPVKAPVGGKFKDDMSALDQLEYWKLVKTKYTEHNPSVTISVGDNEWVTVAHWLYENWDIVGGLSFLPRDNHVYQLAPYETIDEKKYLEILTRWDHVDFSKIVTYEKVDETEVKKELACVSGVCEIS